MAAINNHPKAEDKTIQIEAPVSIAPEEKTIQIEAPVSIAPEEKTIQIEAPVSIAPEEKTIQIEAPVSIAPEETIQREGKKSFQKITSSGRIYVSKKGWLLRFTILSLLIGITSYNIYNGIIKDNWLFVYTSIMLVHAVIILSVGWFFFKSKKTVILGNDLVSVVIPIYNQKNMIRIVIEAIYASSYKFVEVIAVNDGSTDGTREILDDLKKTFPNLTVIHQLNKGKRKSVAKGFNISKGKFVLIIDSDSVITKNAVADIVGTFNSNPNVGAVAGHAKLWNAGDKFVTKLQDTWYDYSYNIHRTTESVFGNVMCCPGCLSGYRRETIAGFIRYWSSATYKEGDDRMLTTYAYAPIDVKKYISTHNVKLSKFSQKALTSAAEYDDGDDRLLTAQSLSQEWDTVYVPSAVSYTEVPATWRTFFRQLLRWKKGYLRTSLFVSSFFWKQKTNPLMVLLYYIELLTMFTAPLIIFITYFYSPFIIGEYYAPIHFSLGLLLMGLAQGLDYRCRDRGAKYWPLQVLMTCFTTFIQTWLLVPALMLIKKNNWLTR